MKPNNFKLSCPVCGFNKVHVLESGCSAEQDWICEDCNEVYDPHSPNKYRVLVPDDKTRIRKMDRVRIIVPKKFVRCGYPLGLQEAIEKVREIYGPQIRNLVTDIQGFPRASEGSLQLQTLLNVEDTSDEGLVKAAAYLYLCRMGFGGNKRTIHTQEDKTLQDVEMIVDSIRYVITGIRTPGYTSYDGEYDPPYLSFAKRHAILAGYSLYYPEVQSGQLRITPDLPLEIQAINCVKLCN